MKYNLASHPRRGGRATAEARKRRWRLQPTLLALEDRRLLSTWTVTSTLDDGSTGTLRWAIGQANSAGGAETINFDPTVFATPQTITLNGTQLELSDTTGTETVTGPAAGVTVSGNNASRVFQVDPGVTASISGLTISAGQTDSAGAGMFNSGNTTLIDCTISGNTAGTGSGTAQGGGIDNNGTLSLTSSTISGNRAYGSYSYSHGGGIFNSGLLTVTGSTISGNSAPYPGGGGIENSGGTVTLTDTIVAGNDYGDIVGPVTGTYNLIGTGGSGGLVNGVNGNLVGVANPGLGALGNYGGQTETIPLLPGSPAVDAGTSAGATATDQRGEPRVGGIDIGAFESQGFTMTALAGSTPQSAAIGSAFASPLGVALTANNPVEPVDGGVVTFVADPATDGASVAFLSATSVVIAGGQVTVSAAPNNMDGSYTATASILGLPTATFDLTNTGPVFAKLTVNTTSDALFPGAGLLSLREAITFANFDLVGNTNITFSRTVFSSPQTITLTGAQLELSNTSEPETITGQKARVTISGAGLSRVFLVDDLVTASLSGLTITGGNVGYGTGGGGGGGLANFGTTTLTGCTVTGNTSYSAGGLFNGGTTTLKDCIISDNSTTGFIGRGGGMLNSGAATLNDCTVSGNTAALGGGLYANYAAASTALSGCTISNNASNGIGGGLFLFGKSNLTDCTVTDNNANGSNAGAHFAIWSGVQGGGGLALGGPTTLTDCTVNGNSSPSLGGGVSLCGSSTLTMTGCTVSGNKAGVNTQGRSFNGGGVSLAYFASGTLTGCTISGNNASGNGGGVSSTYGSTTSLIKCTISGNSAVNGGGAYTSGATSNYGTKYSSTTTLSNCTVSGNSATGNGGGLDNSTLGSTTLTGTSVSGNSAVAGGGIFNQAALSVASSTFNNNKATGESGGGLAAGGGILSSGGSVALSSSKVMVNTAIGGAGASGGAGGDGIGGGLALENNATATVNSTVFLRNLAQGGAGGAGANGGDGNGGAIAVAIGNVFGKSDTSSLSITGSLVTGNFAQGGRAGSGAKGGNAWGGGAWVGADGSASFDQSNILLNEALTVLFGNSEGSGGGLYVATGGVVTLKKSAVAQNLASTSNSNIYGTVIYE